MAVAEQVTELAEGVARSEGLELVHVEFQPRGKDSVLRVYIDKPGGVTLADCQQVSRQLSTLLDVEDVIAHHYTLEVSSPGLDRPLWKLQDYERFHGRRASLQTRRPVDGRRNFRGEITGVTNDRVQLQVGGQQLEIPFSEIARGRLIFEFNPARTPSRATTANQGAERSRRSSVASGERRANNSAATVRERPVDGDDRLISNEEPKRG